MENLTEKEMEDALAANPEEFLGEPGLTLVSRQLKIDRYIFDLLFEDRHGGKLIVELQKGTLDRTHTYKILDYYHAYREKHPHDFIELMVVANNIPLERKRRLQDLGIEYREIPESRFLPKDFKPRTEAINELTLAAPAPTPHPAAIAQPASSDTADGDSYHFHSLGDSAFVVKVRKLLLESASGDWEIRGGTGSLVAKHRPAMDMIANAFGSGMVVQIWLEAPKRQQAKAKFEFASEAKNLSKEDNKDIREKLAQSFRQFLASRGLPDGVETSTGSTTVLIRLDLPGILGREEDTPEKVLPRIGEARRVVEFQKYLDENMQLWCRRDLPKLLQK